MSALLISAGRAAIPGFLREHVQVRGDRLRIGFVAAASQLYGDAPWLQWDRRYLAGHGAEVVELDLTRLDGPALDAALTRCDAVYVAGGNTFHLLHLAQRSGFLESMPAHLSRGLGYIGISAGAVLAGPDIAPVALLDDPAETAALDSTTGLGIVGFVPIPHADGALPDFPREATQRVLATYGGSHRLHPLNDDEALLVTEGNVEVVPSGD